MLRTPLYEFHIACGAKMVDFAGWEMPLLYRGITAEHLQTRRSGSLFDVSHMGRLHITGKDTVPFLDKVLTRNVSAQRIGQIRYSLVCNPAGGILDDIVVGRDAKHWLIICNASNREKIVSHLSSVASEGFDAQVEDRTQSTAMVAVQGPKVIDELTAVLGLELSSIPRWNFEHGRHLMTPYAVFRSGYTGEDGVEIILSSQSATAAIKSLSSELCKPDSLIQPAGLGARDTLRLEAAMPLYGHELNQSIDPLSAGLNWAVDLNKDFIGADPIRTIAKNGPAKKLVGLELIGQRIARQGFAVLSGSAHVGEITSGTFSPTLQKSIAMAYVDSNHANDGTELLVDLRSSTQPAKIVPLPFYRRPTKT
jgi:glycine cleavage system T protein (aminomethyltransferase)